MGQLQRVFWEERTLFATYIVDEGDSDAGNALALYDSATGAWTPVAGVRPAFSNYVQLYQGRFYFISDFKGTVSSISCHGGERRDYRSSYEPFLYGGFSILDGYLYLPSLKDGLPGLTILDLETGAEANAFLLETAMPQALAGADEMGGFRPRLLDSWLYLIPGGEAEGQLRVFRTELKINMEPQELDWEEIQLIPGAEVDDYDKRPWGITCVELVSEDKILVESPDGKLMLCHAGETYTLWTLPEEHGGAGVWAPRYYVSNQAVVAVYEQLQPPAMRTARWPVM